MKTTGERIRQKRLELGLTQQQVADHFGIRVPSVSEWESGKTMPTSSRLSALARMYKTSVDYLLTGREASGNEEEKGEYDALYSRPIPSTAKSTPRGPNAWSIPILTRREVMEWVKGGNVHPQDWITSPYKLDVDTRPFAMEVDSFAMYPDFKDGDVIIVAPGIRPKNKSMVVAQTLDDITVRQYVVDGPTRALRTLAPDWPGERYRIVDEHVTILGTVIGKWVIDPEVKRRLW